MALEVVFDYLKGVSTVSSKLSSMMGMLRVVGIALIGKMKNLSLCGEAT